MSRRSLWAWGAASQLPAEDKRAPMAQLAEATLGFAPPAVLPYPKPDDIDLKASDVRAPDSLQHCLHTDKDSRLRHTYGRSYSDQLRGLYGNFDRAPTVVARPESEAEVAQILDFADAQSLRVVPFGGGTSVVGGVGCDAPRFLSLDTGALNRVLDVDPLNRWARVQAGVLGPDLEAQLAQHDMTLRFFPQSFEFSTLGGWIATRAGGHFATLATHIDDLVAGLNMITPSGDWRSRPLPASGAGPSPDRLLLGSEGSLGVITEATVRVRPREIFRGSIDVLFDDFFDAIAAARELAQSGLHPSNCRVLDAKEAQINSVVSDNKSVLLLAFESSDHDVNHDLKRGLDIALSHRGVARGSMNLRRPGDSKTKDSAAGRWKSAFFQGPYLQSILMSLGVLVDTFETSVSYSGFEELHAALQHDVRDALRRVCGRGELSCRITHLYPDGLAPYYTFVGPARPGSELSQWTEIKAAASEALLKHGASITHHHAVGRIHAPWYKQQAPALFQTALAAAKKAVDPQGLMNPGVLGLE